MQQHIWHRGIQNNITNMIIIYNKNFKDILFTKAVHIFLR